MSSRGCHFWQMKNYNNFRVYEILMLFTYQRVQEKLFGTLFLTDFLKLLSVGFCFNNEGPYLLS